jgi:SPP1 family predicted phage head-tail adaptor
MSTAPYIQTGNMRQLGRLEGKSETPNGTGGLDGEWVTERTIWCQIKPLSGSRGVESAQRESHVSHVIYIRHQDDVAPGVVEKKRITHNGFSYDIVAAWNPESQPEFVHMTAMRGAGT